MPIDFSKIEDLSKTFSLKLADELEKQRIDIDKACGLMQEFLQLAESASTVEEIEKFIDEI
jgi:hypothetical protein